MSNDLFDDAPKQQEEQVQGTVDVDPEELRRKNILAGKELLTEEDFGDSKEGKSAFKNYKQMQDLFTRMYETEKELVNARKSNITGTSGKVFAKYLPGKKRTTRASSGPKADDNKVVRKFLDLRAAFEAEFDELVANSENVKKLSALHEKYVGKGAQLTEKDSDGNEVKRDVVEAFFTVYFQGFNPVKKYIRINHPNEKESK